MILCALGRHKVRILSSTELGPWQRTYRYACSRCGRTRTQVRSAYGRTLRTTAWLALLLLVALPLTALAQPVTVYRSPYIPTDLGDPRNGTVVVQMSVWSGTAWATDVTLVQPSGLSVDCGDTLPEAVS